MFEDYAPEELYKISLKMYKDEDYLLADEAKEHLSNYFEYIYKFRDKYFGNARTVRKVVNDSIKNQNLRLSNLDIEERTQDVIKRIELADVSEFSLDTDGFVFNRKTIGFRKAKKSSGE